MGDRSAKEGCVCKLSKMDRVLWGMVLDIPLAKSFLLVTWQTSVAVFYQYLIRQGPAGRAACGWSKATFGTKTRWFLRHANGSLMAQTSQYRLPETDVAVLSGERSDISLFIMMTWWHVLKNEVKWSERSENKTRCPKKTHKLDHQLQNLDCHRDQFHFLRARQLAQRNLCSRLVRRVFPEAHFYTLSILHIFTTYFCKIYVRNGYSFWACEYVEAPDIVRLSSFTRQIARRHGRWQGNEWRACTDPQQVWNWKWCSAAFGTSTATHHSPICQGWNISFPSHKSNNLVAIATVQDFDSEYALFMNILYILSDKWSDHPICLEQTDCTVQSQDLQVAAAAVVGSTQRGLDELMSWAILSHVEPWHLEPNSWSDSRCDFDMFRCNVAPVDALGLARRKCQRGRLSACRPRHVVICRCYSLDSHLLILWFVGSDRILFFAFSHQASSPCIGHWCLPVELMGHVFTFS